METKEERAIRPNGKGQYMTNDTTTETVTPHWHDGEIDDAIVRIKDEWDRDSIAARSFTNLGVPCTDDACAMRVSFIFGEYSDDDFRDYEASGTLCRFLVTTRERDLLVQTWVVEATCPEAARERSERGEATLIDSLSRDSERIEIDSIERIPGDALEIPGEMPLSRFGMLRATAAAVGAHTNGSEVAPWALEALACAVRGDTVAAEHILLDHGVGALL